MPDKADAIDILFKAHCELTQLANQVGIDATALLNALPESAKLMTGASVPVIHKKYLGTCSVLLHINQTKSGYYWPLLRLSTFKHGGIENVFNGLDWLKRNNGFATFSTSSAPKNQLQTPIFLDNTAQQQTLLAEDKKRAVRFEQLNSQYNLAQDMPASHPWIRSRLCEYATPILLQRIAMKVVNNEILLPLNHNTHGHTGFHKIITGRVYGDKKFHFAKQRGVFKGSYITISATFGGQFLPIALCEGAATGLSIALVWPGEIRIALSCHNMVTVRQQIEQPVIIFNDEDIWKKHLPNAGRNAANNSKRENDIICSPSFSCASYETKPTDFNDLLMLDGFDYLNKQISEIMTRCLG